MSATKFYKVAPKICRFSEWDFFFMSPIWRIGIWDWRLDFWKVLHPGFRQTPEFKGPIRWNSSWPYSSPVSVSTFRTKAANCPLSPEPNTESTTCFTSAVLVMPLHWVPASSSTETCPTRRRGSRLRMSNAKCTLPSARCDSFHW